MQGRIPRLYALVVLCAANSAWFSRGIVPHLTHYRGTLAEGSSPPSVAVGAGNSSSAPNPAPPAPGLLSLLPELLQLSKGVKVSGFDGGGFNVSFTDPLPLANSSTPANISGDLVQSDMHSNPGGISIDVTVDPAISVGGNVNIITPGMTGLPGLTGAAAPAGPTPGTSLQQPKALSLAPEVPDAPGGPAVPPMLRPAASVYFDSGRPPSAADATLGNASGNATLMSNQAADAGFPASAAPEDPSGSAGPGLRQRQDQGPLQAVSSLLSFGRMLNISQVPSGQPGALLAQQPGDPAKALAPSEAASPAAVAEDVLAGLRSAWETVADAEGSAPNQAGPAPQDTATAQPTLQAADDHQGDDTAGIELRYAYTWAVILAAVSSTVSCALLLAALLALGLGRRCRPPRTQTPMEARNGAVKKPPGGGAMSPPSLLHKCKPSRGGHPGEPSQRRQPVWMDVPRREVCFGLAHFSSHVAPETAKPALSNPVTRADEASMPPASPASSEGPSLPSSTAPLMSGNIGKEESWISPVSSPMTSTAAGTPLPWRAGSDSGPVPMASPFANAAGANPGAGRV